MGGAAQYQVIGRNVDKTSHCQSYTTWECRKVSRYERSARSAAVSALTQRAAPAELDQEEGREGRESRAAERARLAASRGALIALHHALARPLLQARRKGYARQHALLLPARKAPITLLPAGCQLQVRRKVIGS